MFFPTRLNRHQIRRLRSKNSTGSSPKYRYRRVLLWGLLAFKFIIGASIFFIHVQVWDLLRSPDNKIQLPDIPIVNHNTMSRDTIGESSKKHIDLEPYYYYADDVNLSWEGDLPENIKREALQRIQSVHIVISHCDKSLEWIEKKFLKDQKQKVSGITVITKCGNEVTGISNDLTFETINLTNVGRCDHSYAYWISHYGFDSISEDSIILFMKDSNYQMGKWRSFQDIIAIAAQNGFSCASSERFGRKKLTTSIFHDTSLFSDFHIESHTREGKKAGYIPPDEKEKLEFSAVDYQNLGQYADFIGFKLQKPFVPVCYGGVFASTVSQIRRTPNDKWSVMEKSLSRRDNLEEGHFAERLWGPVLTKTLNSDAVSKINNQMDGSQCHMEGSFSFWFANHCGILTYSKS